MSYRWPGIPNGDYSFDHGRAVWNKIINYLRRLSEKLDEDIVDATADRRGMMTAADKDKLDGVEAGAEVNQNAFSGVKVGNATIEADSKTDVLELAAGTNISLTVDTTNDKVTFTHASYTAQTGKPTANQTPGFGDTVTISQIVSDTTGHVTAANDKTITIPSTEATQSAAGLMSATDKTKLDGIASGAEVNQNAFSNIQVGPATVAADSKTDTLTLGPGAGVIISANTTNDSITIGCVEATQSVPGIISTADKTKLDGISAGAEVNQNAFAIVKVGATNVTADAKQDTLNLSAGTGITLNPNATTDTIEIKVTDNTYADASHTHAYLPLSGGTLTGNLVLENASVGIVDKYTSSESHLMGSPDLANGASFIAYGKDHAAAGAFRIRAFGDHDLIGTSTGELKWKNNPLIPVIYSYFDDYRVIRKYENKLLIIAASANAVNGGSITFTNAFSKVPIVLCEHPGTVAVHAQAYNVTTTKFNVSHSYSSAVNIKYIAIGLGA